MYSSARNNLVLIILASAFFPVLADAATLRIAPSSASVAQGETVSVTISLTSSDQAMNATEGVLKFPSNLLQVVALSKGGSVLGLWVQEPSFSNAAGTVSFEGVALNPGYIGSNGTVLTVTFRALSQGSAALSIIGGSVLANDGNGTEILTGTSGATISINAATERPEPVPEQEAPQSVPQTKPQQPVEIQTEKPVTNYQSSKFVVEKPYAGIVEWFHNIRPLVLPGLILIFCVLNALLFMQYLRLRKREGGELDHAQVLTHRSFLLLRDDVDTFVKELEDESTKRKLTPIESRFVKEMRSDLSTAEKTIIKELRASEKKL